MHLTHLIDKNRILLNLTADSPEQLISKLVDSIMRSSFADANPGFSREQIVEYVWRREQRGTTALGNGFGYPHARIPGCHGAAIAIATLAVPLEMPGTPDGQPIDTVCMMVGPEEDPNLFLKVMSSLAQFMGATEQREALRAATDPDAAYAVIAASNLSTDISVVAKDIMRPLLLRLNPSDLLKQVARQMLKHNFDAAPVLDPEGRVQGEITSDLLFQYGLPDFFSKLQSVSFIREFDPSEKYFEVEARSTAGKVMSKDFAVMPVDATLLEIVFLLAVKKHPKVYIEDENGKCVGVIDRIVVLDRVINI